MPQDDELFLAEVAKEIEEIGKMPPEEMLQYIASLGVSLRISMSAIKAYSDLCDVLAQSNADIRKQLAELKENKKVPISKVIGEA